MLERLSLEDAAVVGKAGRNCGWIKRIFEGSPKIWAGRVQTTVWHLWYKYQYQPCGTCGTSTKKWKRNGSDMEKK